ncbi:MAG: hypothetical protein VX246_04250 [Myxococcota bacterium]|nr:hypothetical protein [Myxococcota bacterium]
MGSHLKQKVVLALIGFVLVWPAAQFAVVHHTRSNPWHMFGMAMYTVPYRVESIGVGRVYDGEPRAFEDGYLPLELRNRLDDYALLFDGTGRWADTGPLLAALRRADPDADSFLVVPKVVRMNREAGMLEVEKVQIELGAQ